MRDCIGIDIGYGFTKTHCFGKSHVFPTMVHLTSAGKKFTEMKPITANRNMYLVGKDAEREGNQIDTRTPDFVTSDPWMAVLGYALRLNEVIGFANIVLGVPPGMYSDEYADQISKAIRASSISPNGAARSYTFGSIHVIPQGVGIFLRYLQDHPGDAEKTVVVIDIGYRTIDMVLFSEGQFATETIKSNRDGVSYLFDGISAAFDKKYHQTLFYKETLQFLQEGSIRRLNKEYRLDEPEEVKGYVRKVVSSINSFIDGLPVAADLAIVGGGGIHVLKDRFEGLQHDLIIAPDPDMANAMGYWLYGAHYAV